VKKRNVYVKVYKKQLHSITLNGVLGLKILLKQTNKNKTK
jgi:hypothetical protein